MYTRRLYVCSRKSQTWKNTQLAYVGITLMTRPLFILHASVIFSHAVSPVLPPIFFMEALFLFIFSNPPINQIGGKGCISTFDSPSPLPTLPCRVTINTIPVLASNPLGTCRFGHRCHLILPLLLLACRALQPSLPCATITSTPSTGSVGLVRRRRIVASDFWRQLRHDLLR